MLTIEQKACNDETWTHINRVQYYINIFVKELIDRALNHDQSKLKSPEVEAFTEVTPILKHLTYGSPEYIENTNKLGDALKHHYAKNRHHPQHFKNGVDDMNLLDLVKMFCDWKAATERHNDGNIRKSIQINADRNKYNINPQLVKILENTVELFE